VTNPASDSRGALESRPRLALRLRGIIRHSFSLPPIRVSFSRFGSTNCRSIFSVLGRRLGLAEAVRVKTGDCGTRFNRGRQRVDNWWRTSCSSMMSELATAPCQFLPFTFTKYQRFLFGTLFIACLVFRRSRVVFLEAPTPFSPPAMAFSA